MRMGVVLLIKGRLSIHFNRAHSFILKNSFMLYIEEQLFVWIEPYKTMHTYVHVLWRETCCHARGGGAVFFNINTVTHSPSVSSISPCDATPATEQRKERELCGSLEIPFEGIISLHGSVGKMCRESLQKGKCEVFQVGVNAAAWVGEPVALRT